MDFFLFGWKYCSLIRCERKTLFVRWNNTTHNTNEQGHYPYLLRNLASFPTNQRPKSVSVRSRAAHACRRPADEARAGRRRQPVQEHLDRRHLNSHLLLHWLIPRWVRKKIITKKLYCYRIIRLLLSFFPTQCWLGGLPI